MSMIPEAITTPDGFKQTPHAYAVQALDRRIHSLRSQREGYLATRDKAEERIKQADQDIRWADFEIHEAERSKAALIAHRNGVLG